MLRNCQLNVLASLLSYLGEQLYPKNTLDQIFLLAIGKQERGLKVLKWERINSPVKGKLCLPYPQIPNCREEN